MLSPLRLGTNGIFLLRLPTLPPEPDGEVTTGAVGVGVFFPALAGWSAALARAFAAGAVLED